MRTVLVCQSAYQSFPATRAQSDPGRVDWDWTPVWRCPLESPEPRGSLYLGLWEMKKNQKNTETQSWQAACAELQ